jgi:hypothetical protein
MDFATAHAGVMVMNRLQRFTLTCGREERFSIAALLLPRASIVHDNK